ncbi:MAG: hypothetical protein ACXVK3_13440 [Candidatus Angelobacter sp.]
MALLLLAADDLQFIRRRRLFSVSGIGNFSDWALVVAGWQPPWAWRVGLVALGTVTYFLLFVPLCLRELRPHIGRNPEIRVSRARQLTVVPYLTGGVLSCAAGALNPVWPLLILVSAAAASFGGHSGLAWMWTSSTSQVQQFFPSVRL